MQKRLCGREQEFGIKVTPSPNFLKYGPGDVKHYFQSVAESILVRLGKKYESIGTCELTNEEIPDSPTVLRDDMWFVNGSRIYIDLGILETALPEHLPCTLDSVLYEKASEVMLNAAIAEFTARNARYKSVSLYKNNISYDNENGMISENTYGSHHNYSCSQKAVRKISGLLRNFLPAALPLTGSGHILYAGSVGKYCFSQRAKHISSIKGSDTVNNRSLINTRGTDGAETLMPENGLARLHLISCDATRCEFQTWLVEGILHLVIRLAEEGWELPRNSRLSGPLEILKSFNLSMNANNVLIMTSGKKIRALDYLRMFLAGARQLRPLSEGEKKCLAEWENVLDLLEDAGGGKLIGKLDWATKLYLLKNQMKKHKFNLDDGQALRINMEYHNISADPNVSWFARLQEGGYITRLSTDKQVESAIYNAPLTRASARGKFIRQCLRDGNWRKKIRGISWSGAVWSGIPVSFGKDGNPFSTELIGL